LILILIAKDVGRKVSKGKANGKFAILQKRPKISKKYRKIPLFILSSGGPTEKKDEK